MTTTERIEAQSFMYEPTCPPTIPPGMTMREYQRARARVTAPRRPHRSLLLRPLRRLSP